MDPQIPFQEAVTSLLTSVLEAVDIEYPAELVPAAPGFGDLAFPCFPLAKVLRKSPVSIATDLMDACNRLLAGDSYPHIEKVEAAQGYLNFYFNERALMEKTLEMIITMLQDYGSGDDQGISIILEHTSANPNGPFHVGRARNPIIGDTLGRILKFAGYRVTTEYYVNDMGKQAVTLAWGVGNLADAPPSSLHSDLGVRNIVSKHDHRLVPYYQQASSLMDKDVKVKNTINSMLEAYENGDRTVGENVQKNCDLVLDGMKETLKLLNVQLDGFKYESKFVFNGDVQQIIEILKKSPHSDEDEGAFYLDLEPFGVHGRDTRFFFTRAGGTSLYTTRDLAYHQDKFKRADRVVNILGEDHKLQAQQLGIALGELGEERRPEPIFYSFVSLPEGKMSTRKNRVVYLDNLLEEANQMALYAVKEKRPELAETDQNRIARLVAIGAVRYNIIRVQMEKGIIFKWEEALNFEGDSAPFIQYTHARACSILKKGNFEETDDGTPEHFFQFGDTWYQNNEEIHLIRLLSRFPGIVRMCGDSLKAHPLASYLRDLAQQFNQFYRECPVLMTDGDIRESRLYLVKCFTLVIANGLALLGIEAPDSM